MESKKCERKGRCMSRILKVGDHFEMVSQRGKNVIIQQISGRRDARRVVIIGNGHSIELDDKNNVIWKDPGMRRFTPKFKQKDIAIYAFYFVRKVANLEDSAKELADFISSISRSQEVILVGHSKSGICVERACDYARRRVDVCVAVSTPHQGTIAASDWAFARALGDGVVAKIYQKAFSDHQVDRDILPFNMSGKNMKKPVNCIKHINVVSVIDWHKSIHPVDLGSMILDNMASTDGDGIVSERSQRVGWTDREVRFYVSHARSLNKALRYVEAYLL